MSVNFAFNSSYLTKNGVPWFPIMGEIHYSRYPRKYWKESLYKMKAGGVQVVSSYVIWIHHEEIENEYDFSGNKALREFIKTCNECGLYMMLRIGPWCHGEVRNGGFPDWLLNKDFIPRTNDEKYFETVKRFYERIYLEAEGLLLKDGGPIIGLQIENEYGHCGGLTGIDGENHMRSLYEMSKKIGFDVPIYTATGWGGAVTGGLLPVMGGYCEAPWDQRLTEIEPSGNYIFTHERNDHNIGSDHSFGHGITFDISKFPFLTAELGGGLQVTHHRRPVATATDIGAMSLVKLGSGVNLLGYYMYHGGTNPKGKLSTLQESRATGYANDLPELSYDFNAPIKEYGQISETFKEIKLLAMFIKDFGTDICEMPAHIPESNPTHPDNCTELRSSVRHNGESGYIFVNNYQRRRQLAIHKDVTLTVKLPNESIIFPTIDIVNGDYFFYPFNMKIGDTVLKKALATPLCKINSDYIFYTDTEPCYEFISAPTTCKVITISRADAKNSWKINLEREHLIIYDGTVIQTGSGNSFSLTSITGDGSFKAYPEMPSTPTGYKISGYSGDFTVYELCPCLKTNSKDTSEFSATSGLQTKREANLFSHDSVEERIDVQASVDVISDLHHENINKKQAFEWRKSLIPWVVDGVHSKISDSKYLLELDIPENVNDCFLNISYEGDAGMLYLGDEMIADNFYTGQIWEVGLKRFNFPKQLVLEISPLDDVSKVYLETIPETPCRLKQVWAVVELCTGELHQ